MTPTIQTTMRVYLTLGVSWLPAWLMGCGVTMPDGGGDTAPVAEGIFAAQGAPLPTASAEQLEAFERGRAVSLRRFDLAEGLGPDFNVSFCTACHERPTVGGSAGLYRNFFLSGTVTDDGAFLPGDFGGVIRKNRYSAVEGDFFPPISQSLTVFAQRAAIPFFGVGLIAEVSDEEILSRVDESDADRDGISGKANFDRGFVGRFGRKSQTVSIEGFIRGPLDNHLGITTDPLTEEQRIRLPVDSSLQSAGLARFGSSKPTAPLQAAAPEGPLTDLDGAPDPELSGDDLFDLVSFAMLLAAPQPEEPTAQTTRGSDLFASVGCDDCHTPHLNGPRGALPLYSDLLLHDMGPELADGLVQGDASGSEFRTQPLWGLASVGPYLHDGRAETIESAILAHGGEGEASRDGFLALESTQQEDILEFLRSLGGRDQFSSGLLPPDAPIPDTDTYGGPLRDMTAEESEQFLRGRELFDREFGHATGAGSPRFNGDSCRACHFEPVIGGAGPNGVNVMRHGIVNTNGDFVPPAVGTILHKQTIELEQTNIPQTGVNVFEHRQTPHVFGLGLIDSIADDVIMSNADPDDSVNGDGITGRVSITNDGRVGRLGWKAQVPSIAEFVRDAMAAEIGLTVEPQDGLTFGVIDDNDDIDDPELSATQAEDLSFFIGMLAPPPRRTDGDSDTIALGGIVFADIGCDRCHIPTLESTVGTVALYSDLLLHEILPSDSLGIEDTSASMLEFRTAPLWGLSETAPYFHTGEADTIEEAILLHEGEAASIRAAYSALNEVSRSALITFLESL